MNKFEVSIHPTAVTFETFEQAAHFAQKTVEILHKEDGAPGFLYRIEEVPQTETEPSNDETKTAEKAA